MTPFTSYNSHPSWWTLLTENRHLQSHNNATAKKWKQELSDQKWIILEGLHIIEMYTHKYGCPPILLVAGENLPSAEICHYLSQTDAAFNHLWKIDRTPLKLISSLNTPAPILALAPPPLHPTTIDILNQHSSLWLDGIQDPGNMGTLLRTALGAGVTHIVAGQGCVDIWSPKVLRAAQGAHFQLDMWQKIDLVVLSQQLNTLPKWGAVIGGTPYYSLPWSPPIALILGNEGQGIQAALQATLTQKIGIPLHPSLDSLNVAVAGALLLFEQSRQPS
jgi:RNA methyltransferase, TrmH family